MSDILSPADIKQLKAKRQFYSPANDEVQMLRHITAREEHVKMLRSAVMVADSFACVGQLYAAVKGDGERLGRAAEVASVCAEALAATAPKENP